jgi:hypothetical protein
VPQLNVDAWFGERRMTLPSPHAGPATAFGPVMESW